MSKRSLVAGLAAALALSAASIGPALAWGKTWGFRTYKTGYFQAVVEGSDGHLALFCLRDPQMRMSLQFEIFPRRGDVIFGQRSWDGVSFLFQVDPGSDKAVQFATRAEWFDNGFQIKRPALEFVQALRKGNELLISAPEYQWASTFSLKGSGKAMEEVKSRCGENSVGDAGRVLAEDVDFAAIARAEDQAAAAANPRAGRWIGAGGAPDGARALDDGDTAVAAAAPVDGPAPAVAAAPAVVVTREADLDATSAGMAAVTGDTPEVAAAVAPVRTGLPRKPEFRIAADAVASDAQLAAIQAGLEPMEAVGEILWTVRGAGAAPVAAVPAAVEGRWVDVPPPLVLPRKPTLNADLAPSGGAAPAASASAPSASAPLASGSPGSGRRDGAGDDLAMAILPPRKP